MQNIMLLNILWFYSILFGHLCEASDFWGGLCVGSATPCHNFVQAPAPPHTLKGQKVPCCEQKLENTTVPVISWFYDGIMALAAENRHEAPQECPVCFENVLLAKRTLSCRHVFCQDCLSKIMVVARSRGSIICPLCRQATYLNKENPADDTLAADVDTTQGVALPLPMGYLVIAARASIDGVLRGGNWMMRHLRTLSRRSSNQTVIYRNGSEVFIISDHVRPTTCSDTTVGIPAEPPDCRVTKSICICLVVVICLITLMWLLVWLLVSHLWGCADSNIHSQDWHIASLCDNGKTLLFTMFCSFLFFFSLLRLTCWVYTVERRELMSWVSSCWL